MWYSGRLQKYSLLSTLLCIYALYKVTLLLLSSRDEVSFATSESGLVLWFPFPIEFDGSDWFWMQAWEVLCPHLSLLGFCPPPMLSSPSWLAREWEVMWTRTKSVSISQIRPPKINKAFLSNWVQIHEWAQLRSAKPGWDLQNHSSKL